MSDQDDKELSQAGFIDRWSARKKQRAQTLESEPVIAGSAVQLDSETQTEQPLTTETHTDTALSEPEDTEPLLTDDDMPAIPTLTAKSDLSAFFNQGVSAGLRRAALRHVFQLPVYNERDGLNDYDDDFTRFEPLGDTITSDMKWHKERKEREAEEAAAKLRAQEELEQEQASQALEESDTERLDDQTEQGDEHTELKADENNDDTGASPSDIDNGAEEQSPESIDRHEGIDSSEPELEGTPT